MYLPARPKIKETDENNLTPRRARVSKVLAGLGVPTPCGAGLFFTESSEWLINCPGSPTTTMRMRMLG